MPRHPDPHIRRAVRVLAMVGELHKRGYQKLRVMPFLNASGTCWRCWVGPDTLFYRNHGAVVRDGGGFDEDQSNAQVARYSSGNENQYFGWKDAENDDARTLADKFIVRFPRVAESGKGWSYTYAGWFQRLLGLAETGWIPIVIADHMTFVFNKIPLSDFRPEEWRSQDDVKPILPAPPKGKLQEDYRS